MNNSKKRKQIENYFSKIYINFIIKIFKILNINFL
jgi:hypothetical protein